MYKRQELVRQYGIGKKVADCICLFGLYHIDAFPVDTHVKKILEAHYPEGFPYDLSLIHIFAKACNVSISTVSNILNGKEKARQETKELVLQKAKEMNYVPNYMAKNLKQKNTKTIGIIAEDLTIFHTPTIVDGISACLEKKGYTLLTVSYTHLDVYKRQLQYMERR